MSLQTFMRLDLRSDSLPDGIFALAERLCRRYEGALRAILLYGSCRRLDNTEGLADLLVIVTDYRRVHAGRWSTLANGFLPPNVYYLETAAATGTVRCKYAVVSEAAFRRRCRGGLDAYFWARFSQPARLAWAADEAAVTMLAACRADAAMRFAIEAASVQQGEVAAAGFWQEALAASYRCELRPESSAAARALVAADPVYWDELSALVLPRLPGVRAIPRGRYALDTGRARLVYGRLRWGLRRVWGKLLNVLRLLKAAGTFSNGIDYLLWKIERHSGVRVQVTERMRSYPRLAAWGLAWKLWRRGAFR